MNKLKNILLLMRVNQWIKNIFIFLPIFFGTKINQINLLINDVYAFIGFSFIASAIYVFNDLLDIESDKLHPKKRNRPLASGEISKKEGYIIIGSLLTIGIVTFAIKINQQAAWLLIMWYILQNIVYTIKLKHVAIIDIAIIALGFLIRIMIGGVVSFTPLSHWIVLVTFLLALFLALAKRRDDVLLFERTGNKMRKNIDGYNLEFLNVSIAIMSAVVIVSYIMYTTSVDVISRDGKDIYYTSFFVIIGILRYLQLTFVKEESGSPTNVLLKDRFLQLTIMGWLAALFILIYINK